MSAQKTGLDVHTLSDQILLELDSNEDLFGVSYYDLPSNLGYTFKEIEACLTDLEDRGFVDYQAEGKIKITPSGTYFINSNSFVQIEQGRQKDDKEKNIDRDMQRENWSTTTKTSKWAIWIAILSLLVAALALRVAWPA